MYIGDKVKELRESQGLTLAELSDKSGVQIATLSRIENKKMVGSLESHIKIAQTLGIDITQLYADMPKEPTKAEKGSPAAGEVFVHSDRSSYEILTSKILKKKMMPILLKIEEGGRTNPEQNMISSEKFIFVLEGKIEAHVGKEAFPLSKNNSLYFDAGQEHYFVNIGKNTAKAVCVLTPAML